MRNSDVTRERLREIETELIEIAMGAYALSDKAYASALLAEAQRIERVTNANRDAAGVT
jgi:hypothetical protein